MSGQIKIPSKKYVEEEVNEELGILCSVNTPVFSTTAELLERYIQNYDSFVNFNEFIQKAIVKMMWHTNFTSDHPLIILRTELNKLNLDLTIFTQHAQMFLKLQHRLYNMLRHSEYCKYASLIMLMNRYDFVEQIDVMWDILENTKHSKGTYFLIEDLINISF